MRLKVNKKRAHDVATGSTVSGKVLPIHLEVKISEKRHN